VASVATTVTEVVTGLGMVGHEGLAAALSARPAELVDVAPAQWDLLGEAWAGGRHREAFEAAWANGAAFLAAREGLRGRRPLVVEWKGSTRAAGDEALPVDLRVDHVYLVSCKYLSKILLNAAPAGLFVDLLAGGQGRRSGVDWFAEVAPGAYGELYRRARATVAWERPLPATVGELSGDDRRWLAHRLRGPLPAEVAESYAALSAEVAEASAQRWRDALRAGGRSERLLWRLLRIHAAPYFVLGSAPAGSLRLRVATPWDWRRRWELRAFEVEAQAGGQPRVGWRAVVRDRFASAEVVVVGHVEVRWAHGRFGGPPEAKVYLDTPHERVPGYVPLA
jgi:hypothetical protein